MTPSPFLTICFGPIFKINPSIALGPHDQRRFAQIKAPKALAAFLSSRHLVQKTLVKQGDLYLDICPDSLGKPILASLKNPYSISLSHGSVGTMVALAPPHIAVGVDIESIERLQKSHFERYMNARELELVNQNAFEGYTGCFWVMWEALSKALGTGLQFDFEPLHIEHIENCGNLGFKVHFKQCKNHIGWVQIHEGLVRGIVLGGESALWSDSEIFGKLKGEE